MKKMVSDQVKAGVERAPHRPLFFAARASSGAARSTTSSRAATSSGDGTSSPRVFASENSPCREFAIDGGKGVWYTFTSFGEIAQW